jgi:rhodanese-related sulfurtransferase
MIYSISVKELLKNNYTNIIDIRSIEKYNDNHMENAKNIPMQLLLQNPSKYLNYNDTYYIYCQKGINSKEVCNRLLHKGYKVVNIIGGYESWLLQK